MLTATRGRQPHGAGQPQVILATLATSSSLRTCCSGVIGLPDATEANPHWVLTASSSSGLIVAASAIRSRTADSPSRSPDLVVSRPSTATTPDGTSASGP